MPLLTDYKLFISHSWKYDEDYRRIIDFLNKANYFRYSNFSHPFDNPLDCFRHTDNELTQRLEQQIAPTQVVLVVSGMYVAYSKWIQKEIDIARYYKKPIIGIKPWGNINTPVAVSSVANEIVGWQTDSIIEAIRRYVG